MASRLRSVHGASISAESWAAAGGMCAPRVDSHRVVGGRRESVCAARRFLRFVGTRPGERPRSLPSVGVREIDRAENAEFAQGVLDRLVPVVGEFLRADATKLGLDHSMLAVLDVLGSSRRCRSPRWRGGAQ